MFLNSTEYIFKSIFNIAIKTVYKNNANKLSYYAETLLFRLELI